MCNHSVFRNLHTCPIDSLRFLAWRDLHVRHRVLWQTWFHVAHRLLALLVLVLLLLLLLLVLHLLLLLPHLVLLMQLHQLRHCIMLLLQLLLQLCCIGTVSGLSARGLSACDPHAGEYALCCPNEQLLEH
jgi:hypothetical protein